MTDPLVRVQIEGGVRTLTLDSPHNRNALSRQLLSELSAAIEAARDDARTRLVILAASGKAFCAGGDLSEASMGSVRESGVALLGILHAILTLDQPVVARVHAPVRAGGIGLVGAADLAFGTSEATFAFSEAKLGLAPAIISLTALPRMEPRVASHAFLTSAVLDGATAEACGLLTRCVGADELDHVLQEEAEALVAASAQGLKETKRLLNHEIVDRLEREGETMVDWSQRLFESDEARASLQAFLGRRSPEKDSV